MTEIIKSQYVELGRNTDNIFDDSNTMKIKKRIRENQKLQPLKRVEKPLLILISGVLLTGKSTLAKFLEEHINY